MGNPRHTVWVVDDSPLDAEYARRALAGSYDVQAFSDGSAVLERLAEGAPPDVVVCDWVMPGVTGIDVCRFIRSSRHLPQVAILLLTARHSTEQIVEGLAAGANDYVAKPYAPAELAARVAALVRSQELLQRVAEAQEELRVLVESSPDPHLSIGAGGEIRTLNAAAREVFGPAAHELRGKPVCEALPELNLELARRAAQLPDIVLNGRTFEPIVHATPDGAMTVSLRDVTERRKAEAKRLDLYAIIAHDMRSPLHALLMRLDLLVRGKRGPLPADLVGDLRRIDSGLRALVAMINDFLELAKLDAGAIKTAGAVDVREILISTLDELKPLADAGLLEVSVDAPQSAPVFGDAKRLSQVFANLFGNAIKFTPSGGRIRAAVEVTPGQVEASISDTGRGIPAEALPTIFNRFTRVPGGEAVVGSGLGLMIVREIVEAHGGRVTVQSVVGEGSTFRVSLPRGART